LLDTLLMLLQGSTLGETVRSGQYLYPVLEAIHILGIALLVGPAFTFDLRLLGVGHRVVSATTAARYLLPVSHIGFAIAVTTGISNRWCRSCTVEVRPADPRWPQRTGVPLRHLPPRR
jgi:hypothetical protein